MKKLTLILTLAAALFAAAPAQARKLAPRASQAVGVSVKSKARAAADSTAIDSIGTPLTSVEGTHALYSKKCNGYTSFMEYVMEYDHPDDVAHVVFGADNTVYFYDILSNGRTDTYAKGTLNGNKITVDLPQTMFVYEGAATPDGLRLTLVNLKVDMEEGTADASRNTDIKSVTYTLADDGTITLDPLPEGTILGFTYISDNTWAAFGDYNQTLTPFTTPEPVIPQDTPIQTWAMTFDYQGYPVPVMRDGDTFYFGGIAPEYAAYWVKGQLENGKITIKNNQYLGLAESDFFIYGMLGTPYDDEFGDISYNLLPADATLTLSFDEATQKITSDSPDVAILINRGQYKPSHIAAAIAPSFFVQSTFAGTPADPMALAYTDYYRDEYNFGVFYFTIPQLSDKGTILNPNFLYYNIYIDGEVYEFLPDESLIEEAMTDIPFTYGNSMDFYINYMRPIEREVGIYPVGASTLGVQSVYRFGGVETRSNIVTIKVEEENSLDTLPGAATAVSYTDLLGRSYATPQPGLNIVRRSDGTSSKIMVK